MKLLDGLSLRTRLMLAFGAVAALLVVVAGLGIWGSQAQSSAAANRTHLDKVVSQTDLIRYYDADVSGWQVAVALDAHNASGPQLNKDSNRVSELADKTQLDTLLPNFPVKYLTPAEARTYRQIVASWATFWRVDKQVFDLYVKGDPKSMALADKITNGAATDEFTALSDQTLALSKAVNARSERLTASATATGSTVRTLIMVGAALALLLAVALGFTITRTLTRRVTRAKARLAEITESTDSRLRPAIEALAAGDLSTELSDSTAEITDIPGDEIGDIMRTGEGLRDTIGRCYVAYNEAVHGLRDLVADVTTMAVSVGDASEQMATTSGETGKATAEVANAIEHVAQGAERQVQLIETARNAADEVAAAVQLSAENAEQTAEVASRARETADDGVAAAEQANTAMQAVRDSSQEVTAAIGELASKSERIGAIVQTITGIAEQTNLLALNAAIEAARASASTEETSASTQQVAASAAEMATSADRLRGLVGRFRLDGARVED